LAHDREHTDSELLQSRCSAPSLIHAQARRSLSI
jgi:hypothetical protein